MSENTPVESTPAGSMIRGRNELEILVRARYPLVYVVSFEEDRVMREIDRIAAKRNKKVYAWTISRGLVRHRADVGDSGEGIKGTKDPILLLKEIQTFEDPAIFILKDYHPYMKDSNVVRGLRDLSAHLRQTYKTVILISPLLNLPPDLDKDVTIVDFPLPERKDLEQLYLSIARDLQSQDNFKVDTSPEAMNVILEAAVGLTLNEAENVFAKALVMTGHLTSAEVPFIYSEKRQIIRKSGILEYIDVREKMSEVGGLDSLKHWLEKRRQAFEPRAREFGLPVPKGVLFVGVQGCGKSLCAKAVSNMWNLPLLRLDMGRLFSSFIGSSEQNVRQAISVAESVSPVILWLDEIDKGFAGVQSSSFSDSGTTSRVFGTLITWMQEKEATVFVIATANQVENLPPELLRKGRFDEIFFVDLPDMKERKSIFAIHLSKRNRDITNFNLDALAEASDGFSGSEIEQAVVSALYDAFDTERDITTDSILKAIGDTYPLSVTMSEAITRRR
ncbi:MAG TPA: AAA family ATPase, partial [Candidatus Sumerlaeota bacterium]|nr:AAA family ATPase [Candidatus Sumerlaeota bacterium]